MNTFHAKAIIDDEEYTINQLKRYEYERTLHSLHELKGYGASIKDGDHECSHEDINWLNPEKAKQISISVRQQLGEEGILKLLDIPVRDAEKRWMDFAGESENPEIQTATTNTFIRGIDLKSTLAILGGAANPVEAIATFPEHYFVIGDVQNGQRGMEDFGMFGEPVYMHGVAYQQIPKNLPIDDDPAYPLKMCGTILLKRNDFPIHVGAVHQFKPLQDGFDVKSTFFCPKKATPYIAKGHQLHFAIEIVNSARIAYDKNNK